MSQKFLDKCTGDNHRSIITDNDTGEMICSLCGIVIKERIEDTTANSQTFTMEGYLTKSQRGPGTKISMFDMGNSSTISKRNTDADGNSIASKNKSYFSRLRLWDRRSKKNSREANLSKAFINLDSIVAKLSLPENTKEHAAYIYRKAAAMDLIRGSSINSTVAAAVYATCKQLDIPRSLDEIAKTANVRRRTLSRTYRTIVKRLELDGVTKDIDYVAKVASSVDLSEKIKRVSSMILNDAKKTNLHVGKNPVGLAAGAVYIAAIGNGENVTMARISKRNNVSTVTIRKISRLLRPFAAKYIQTITI